MDDQKLRAELESLAKVSTQLHEDSALALAKGAKTVGDLYMGQARGILLSVAQIGLLFDPPLEVVSAGPRYVVMEKKGKDTAAFYEDVQRTEMGL